MITLRRDAERRRDGSGGRQSWLTFDALNRADPLADGFASLAALAESRLARGAGVPRHALRDAEIVTFVREGALAYEDSLGRSGVIHAGEFQHTSAGRGIRRRETNASPTGLAHTFQIRLRPSQADLESGQEQRRFSAAERRGKLCIVASPDARRESLRIHQDALVYSALLDPGQHVVHQIAVGRSAWLHVVAGEATLGDVVLTMGDGVGLEFERAVSLTALDDTEILLLDLGGS